MAFGGNSSFAASFFNLGGASVHLFFSIFLSLYQGYPTLREFAKSQSNKAHDPGLDQLTTSVSSALRDSQNFVRYGLLKDCK